MLSSRKCWDYRHASPGPAYVVLRVKSRALCLPSKHSSNWAISTAQPVYKLMWCQKIWAVPECICPYTMAHSACLVWLQSFYLIFNIQCSYHTHQEAFLTLRECSLVSLCRALVFYGLPFLCLSLSLALSPTSLLSAWWKGVGASLPPGPPDMTLQLKHVLLGLSQESRDFCSCVKWLLVSSGVVLCFPLLPYLLFPSSGFCEFPHWGCDCDSVV